MIPGISIEQLIIGGGVIAVAAIIFAESGLLIGFFLPGDSLIFTAGFLISQNIIHFNVWLLCLILWIAAVLGDSCGYEIGHRYGRKMFQKKDGKLFKKEYLKRAEDFYEKHGAVAIILARFVPIVRTFAPVVAGIGKMTYRHFIAFNLIGAGLWTFGVTLLGYYLGNWFTAMGLGVDQVLLPAICIILFVSVLPAIIGILKSKQSRDAITKSIKGLFRKN